jgi:hypothetical protein
MKKTLWICCLLLALTFFTQALAAPGDATFFTEAQRLEMGLLSTSSYSQTIPLTRLQYIYTIKISYAFQWVT